MPENKIMIRKVADGYIVKVMWEVRQGNLYDMASEEFHGKNADEVVTILKDNLIKLG